MELQLKKTRCGIFRYVGIKTAILPAKQKICQEMRQIRVSSLYMSAEVDLQISFSGGNTLYFQAKEGIIQVIQYTYHFASGSLPPAAAALARKTG